MKTEWKANSTEPADLSGVGAFIFDTGTAHVPFPAFIDFHRFNTLLDRELQNVVWTARNHLKKQIEGIAT